MLSQHALREYRPFSFYWLTSRDLCVVFALSIFCVF